jgi:NitT/TauT family transport system ATP-binding protein
MTKLPPAPDGMVVYEGVSKFFPVRVRPGQKDRPELMVALDRVEASVRKGELVTLLGPSGCGKTTLLRLTAGLIAADEGRITIEGTPVAAPRKDACMVFQNFGLLPWRTVQGNVEFPLEINGLGKPERGDLARHFIELVGLAAFAEHFPHELSGGMQQRVGIARALMRKPILIFMDEPFGALDAQTREQLQEDFLKIWSRTGATVIFVTPQHRRGCSSPTVSSCSTPRPDASVPSSNRPSPASGWAATCAGTPILENTAPNCARC